MKNNSLGSILYNLFVSNKHKDISIDGWKDDKEKFKIDLVNDIKTFLFGKWEKPWKAGLVFNEKGEIISGFRNISGKIYHNHSNMIALDLNKGKSPFFITIEKLKKLSGKIIDASKIVNIISFIPIIKERKLKAPEVVQPDYMLPKFHDVINVDFVEGIKVPNYKTIAFEKLELNQYVEKFIDKLKTKKRIPKLIYDQADKAFFQYNASFTKDEIHLVNINQFKGIEHYYSTLFHEIIHSTKNPSRCGRGKETGSFLPYANEELVAEMGSMIVCSELGLNYQRQNSITYLREWLSGTKGDKDKAMIEAYAYACDAAEYLMKDIDMKKLVPNSMAKRAKKAKELSGFDTKPRFSEVKKINRKDIILKPEWFQGRKEAFSKESVDKILDEGFDLSNDPIIVWKDKESKKYILISGHSRWEASRILFERGDKRLAQMPVKEFLGDKQAAIHYATFESNRSSKAEGILSDLQAVRNMVKEGFNRKEMLKYIVPGSYLDQLIRYTYLNPKGRFIQHIINPDGMVGIKQKAEWVGILRYMYGNKITDAHESEMFDFFFQHTKKSILMDKGDFDKLVEKRIMRLDFNPEHPLNLKEMQYKNPITDEAREQIAEIEKQIEHFETEINRNHDLIVKARQDHKPTEKYDNEITLISKRIVGLKEDILRIKRTIAKMESESVVDLFSQEDENEKSKPQEPKIITDPKEPEMKREPILSSKETAKPRAKTANPEKPLKQVKADKILPKIKTAKTTAKTATANSLNTEIRFIKHFIALNGKKATAGQIKGFLNSLQEAITDGKIRKTSALVKEISYVQDSLVKIYNMMDDVIEISIDAKRIVSLKASYANKKDKSLGFLPGIVSNLIASAIYDKASTPKTPAPDAVPANDPVVPAATVTDQVKLPYTNSMDIANMEFETYGLTGKFKDFLGDPAIPSYFMMSGEPGSGKSTFSIEFAHALAQNLCLNVAFVAKEEGLGYTLKDKFQRLDAFHPNLHIYTDKLPEDISKYDFIFIDSVNEMKIPYDELSKLQEKARASKTSMFNLFQSTKDGKFRGSEEFAHLADVIIFCKDGVAMTTKNRFGKLGSMNIFETELAETY